MTIDTKFDYINRVATLTFNYPYGKLTIKVRMTNWDLPTGLYDFDIWIHTAATLKLDDDLDLVFMRQKITEAKNDLIANAEDAYHSVSTER